jgi:hypothetical protein
MSEPLTFLPDVNVEQVCEVEHRQTTYFTCQPSAGEKFQTVKDTVAEYVFTLDIPDDLLAFQQNVLTQLYHRQQLLLSITSDSGFMRFRVAARADEEDPVSFS